MFEVLSIKVISDFAGPGLGSAYDAEAKVLKDYSEEVYVHVGDFTLLHYMVTDSSSLGDSPEDTEDLSFDIIEEYSSAEEAAGSDYYPVFNMLTGIIGQMIEGPQDGKMDVEYGESKETADFKGEEYKFAIEQDFEFEGEEYKALVELSGYWPTFAIYKDGETVEEFDNLEAAVYSKWFSVLLEVKKELVELITDYAETHEEKDKILTIINYLNP